MSNISTFIHNYIHAYAQMTLNRNQCFQTIKIFFINRKMILPDLNKTCRIYPHLSTFTRTYPLHTHYIPTTYPPFTHHIPTYTHIRPEARLGPPPLWTQVSVSSPSPAPIRPAYVW